MQFLDLFPDVYGEIFSYLKPYALSQVSQTSKAIRHLALTENLWKVHLESEFAWCVSNTGSAFEKYSICKRKSFKHIQEPECRKLMLLVEAGHLEEIKIHLPQCKVDTQKLKSLTLKNKSLCLMISEHPDHQIRDFFLKWVEEQGDCWSHLFAWYFGKLENFRLLTSYYYIIPKDYFNNTIEYGGVASLEHLFQKLKIDFKYYPYLTTAAEFGSLEKVKWLLDHGDKITCDSIIYSAKYKELLQYFIKNHEIPLPYINAAIHSAVWNWNFDALKILLPSHSLTSSLQHFNFLNATDRTPACLKLLFEYRVLNPSDAIIDACSYPNNESSVKFLLENGADANVIGFQGSTPLSCAIKQGNITVINMLKESIEKITK